MPSPRAARAPRACCALALLAACVDSPSPNLTTTHLADATDTSSTSPALDTTASPTPTSTSTAPGSTFIVPTDLPDCPTCGCDPFAQDCPPGEKCTWFALGGGSAWDETRCVPIMEYPAQVGEDCFVVDHGVSGVDNCDLGLMCWDTDEENQGFCIALCTGTPEALVCAPGFVCEVYQSGLARCIDTCDPLMQDCAADEVCVRASSDSSFQCVDDASGAQGLLPPAVSPCRAQPSLLVVRSRSRNTRPPTTRRRNIPPTSRTSWTRP